MYSTAIVSLSGGNISINALSGSLGVGSRHAIVVERPNGIFTVGKSDVTVIASGDIDLNGSRIAAFNGGNVTVESLAGNVRRWQRR